MFPNPRFLTIFEPVREAFLDQHGFDPTGVYCQITGRRIGTTDSSELELLIGLVNEVDEGDAEAIADDLAIRVLASMRPSICWNKMRSESLKELRVADPIGTLAYLINRMFAPLNHRKIAITDLLGVYADRIRTYRLLEERGITDATNTILYMLLELDAKWNLDTETPPFNAFDFLRYDITDDHRVEMVQAWYERRIAAYDKKVKADELQSRWFRDGNILAKPAFLDAYIESKPLSKTAAKKQEKKQESDFFAGLLSEIRMGKAETEAEAEAIEPKPAFIPIRKMPARFGVKA